MDKPRFALHPADEMAVRALSGRLSTLSTLRSKSRVKIYPGLYGAFVWRAGCSTAQNGGFRAGQTLAKRPDFRFFATARDYSAEPLWDLKPAPGSDACRAAGGAKRGSG